MAIDERCAVCGRDVPSSTVDRDTGVSPRGVEGWVDFGGYDELVIAVPYPESSTLPLEVIDAMREFEGLVRVEPDPQVDVARLRELETGYAGTVCPDCCRDPERAGWDTAQWLWFLSDLQAKRDHEGS